MAEFHIYLVSDGTGETASKITKAAVLQFEQSNIVFTRHSNVRSRSKILEVVQEAEKQHALIVHTFASHDLRNYMREACEGLKTAHHDLLGALFERLEDLIGAPPREKPGLLHQIDDHYFRRIDALAFTVRHDETRDPEEIQSADIILLGVSRTSKTPVSIYLAQEGWKVANIPIVMGEELPRPLFEANPGKVVGFLITAERLVELRKARLKRLGTRDSTYADIQRVTTELEYCRKLFDQHPEWTIVDVTGKSVEETAAEILDKMFGKERRP